MIHRILKPSKTQSFFLFGARGTGKSTYLKKEFGDKCHFINLLEDEPLMRYSSHPDRLATDLKLLDLKKKWVVIDEIQKIPKLLDSVHHLIEERGYKFILTGSSARKLKRQSANLLAGRAFNYQMYPLTHLEIGDDFDLDDYLQWGGMPKIFSLGKDDKAEFLRSYTQTYLREEVLQEQIVRNGIAFRSFLEIAAQTNGTLINFSKIAKDINVDTKTIQSYYQILEDTLVGFFLPAFHKSIRKSVGLQPKFYLFDLGVKRALDSTLQQKLTPKSSSYGKAFEHFIICEILRINSYSRSDYHLYHYHTTAGGEVDLVLTRGREVIAIEIKSTSIVQENEVIKFHKTASALKPTQMYFVSQDPYPVDVDLVSCLHWKSLFKELF